MNRLLKIFLIGIIVGCKISVSAQEIKVMQFRLVLNDISAREKAIYDANGDACAIIKVRTGLENLKFSSDLEIRKIENHEGEYWLWVSPNSSKIRIEAIDIGILEYILPKAAESYNVYIVFLTVLLPENILYKNINTLKIETIPSKAEIFSDSIFMGLSPMSLNISSDTFTFEIHKKNYIPQRGSVTLTYNQKNILVYLKKNPESNRLFLNSFVAYCSYSDLSFGIQGGIIGKTGWYLSLVPPIRARNSIVLVKEVNGITVFEPDESKFNSLFGESSDNFTISLKNNNYLFYNNLRLKGGITQRIYKNTYLLAGIGFADYREFYRIEVTPKPTDKNLFGKSDDLVGWFCLESGLIFRLSNSFLINFNVSTTGFAHYFTGKTGDFIFPLEGSFGFGYNF